MSEALRPRPWPVAALAGAYAVIVPAALLSGAFRIVAARQIAGEVSYRSDPVTVAEAITMGLTVLGSVSLAGSVVGVPAAMLFAGIMAWLERLYPAAQRLAAWLAAAFVAAVPAVGLAAAAIGSAVLALPLFACALVGAAVAWAVRHRALERAASAR